MSANFCGFSATIPAAKNRTTCSRCFVSLITFQKSDRSTGKVDFQILASCGDLPKAATLSVVPAIPMVALATIVGIDRFMSECRAITNIIGNGVATLAVARWEGELDMERLNSELNRR